MNNFITKPDTEFEKLKQDICKMVCEYLRKKGVDENIITPTAIKILAFGNELVDFKLKWKE